MLAVSEPGALNYFTFFRPISLALSVSRNLILTYFPLSGFLGSLLCVLIVPTSGLAFSLVKPRTPAAASSFSSNRVYPSLNLLPPLSLRLTPTPKYRVQHLSKQLLLSLSLFLMFMLLPFVLLRRIAEPTRPLPPFFLPPEISSFSGTSTAITPLGLRRYFQPSWGGSIRLGHLF